MVNPASSAETTAATKKKTAPKTSLPVSVLHVSGLWAKFLIEMATSIVSAEMAKSA